MYTPTSILPARIVRSLKGSKRGSKHSSANDKPVVTNEPLPSVFEADEGDSCFDDFEEISYDEVPDLDHETSTLDTRSLSPLSVRHVPEISTPFALSPHKPDNPRLNHPRSKSVSHTLPELSLSKSYSRSSLRTLHHPRQSQSRSRLHLPITSTESLLSEFPKPPTHLPTSSPRRVTLSHPPPATGVYFLIILSDWANPTPRQIPGQPIYTKRSLLNRLRTQTHSSHLHRRPGHLRHLLSRHLIRGVPSRSIAASNLSGLHSDSRGAQKAIVIRSRSIEVCPPTVLLVYILHDILNYYISTPQTLSQLAPLHKSLDAIHPPASNRSQSTVHRSLLLLSLFGPSRNHRRKNRIQRYHHNLIIYNLHKSLTNVSTRSH